jgi:hypothetical protein
LKIEEFLRRFSLHLLQERLVKIRHYGLLGNRDRKERIARARQFLGVKEEQAPPAAEAGSVVPEENSRLRCPHCGALALVWIEERPPSRLGKQQTGICDSS